jgi:hypothetical protein
MTTLRTRSIPWHGPRWLFPTQGRRSRQYHCADQRDVMITIYNGNPLP